MNGLEKFSRKFFRGKKYIFEMRVAHKSPASVSWKMLLVLEALPALVVC